MKIYKYFCAHYHSHRVLLFHEKNPVYYSITCRLWYRQYCCFKWHVYVQQRNPATKHRWVFFYHKHHPFSARRLRKKWTHRIFLFTHLQSGLALQLIVRLSYTTFKSNLLFFGVNKTLSKIRGYLCAK